MSDERQGELERFGETIAELQDEALAARDDLGAVRSRLLRRPAPSVGSPGWLAFAAIGLAAAAALISLALPSSEPVPLAFTLPDGTAGGTGAFVSAESPEAIAFGDGSSLQLAAGSDLRFAEVDAAGARLDLQRGHVRLDVVHRDEATRWAVRAGPFVVHVVGTRFAVSWDPETRVFELHMEEGRVELEGPALDRRALSAGETVQVTAPDAPPEVVRLELPAESEGGPGEVAALAEAEPASEAPARHRRAELDWRRLAREGRHRDAVRAANWDRALAIGEPGDLILLGDAARFAGQGGRAAAAYEAIRRRHPDDGRAAQAAFFLGRLALARGDHAAAARHFDDAAAEAPDGPFAAVAEGRRIEAHAAAGDEGAARRAARAYLDRWPEGAHATAARRVLGEPSVAVPAEGVRAHVR